MSKEAKWSDQFQCFVRQALYRAKEYSGILMMEEGGCCDMSGTIKFYQERHPDVRFIATFSAHEPDTYYFDGGGNHWVAKIPSAEDIPKLKAWRVGKGRF